MSKNTGLIEVAPPPRFRYNYEAYRNGKLLWKETFWNTVSLVGKNDLLDKYFGGSAYTAAWYIGLIDNSGFTTGPIEADTMASHSGWNEATVYTEGARQTVAWAAAAAKAKSSSAPCVYTISSPVTVRGGFIASNNTKGGSSGVMYSAGLFDQGSRSLLLGDILKINVTVSVG